jgi:hypothetical protein
VQLANVEFVHIYGSLGPLPWESCGNPIEYGTTDRADIVQRAGENIQVMHEGSADSIQENLEKAKKWLQRAERVLFLGFGFHEDNVKRLALDKVLRKEQDISGTSYNLDNTYRSNVEYCSPWALKPGNLRPDLSPIPTIRFPDDKVKCYEFLHRYADLS